VPVAVKDELDMMPYPTTVGTAFLGKSPAEEDATVVARLRASGALLIGKANMHEIGIGVTGLNPHHGTTRNPYNPDHYTGGSASGPGAAVAAGLCPVAIGADGGGSIRVPSSFCGVVGLKSTFGRVSEFGAAPLCWSVAHLGPLAATATDAALAFGAIAGPDPKDPLSLHQPAPTLEGWDRLDLSDLTLGVYWPWFRHASADVVEGCEALLQQFEVQGARVREVVIPELENGRVAHVITIAAEMSQALGHTYADHHREHGLDVRTNLALARQFTARDYIQAQRVRTRMMAHFDGVLEQVDAIVTPTTGLPAPAIPSAALPDGDSDLTTLTEIMRFATPANLTGLPAISFPAGYNDAGLPLGMQAIGRAWQEHTLLRLALAAEQAVQRQAPLVHYGILAG
jgi:Asp-tRNA(Asn)/Glu-tRNA(Gln) amidotransferase A subunit family amidase